MLGMLYIVVTAVLMLGAVFDQEGWAGLAVVILIVLTTVWLLLSRRDAPGRQERR
ncbi:hypothetical protein [Actinomycetospora chibensis]|uniref:Uncharacterized protein n=1 Tax=Actinomycetospora chibensis TaxID=663606 RepID=A0ABV9REW6_9PSEU|nr:hypothetical protein [Actinomycetospora chibensis]MDD7925042.1 hypothetical protein [Actinomycetospora chibensis]